jgi:light-regulated signal transduction histidine kinase (bacteriophytochrome)
VGQLATSFNKMAQDLRNTTTSIDNLNREITKRKKTEKALKTSNKNLEISVQKLNQLNQQLREFVYIASHDLREPSRKVSSFGGILAESLAGKLNDDEQENLDFMISGAERMQQMVESLLVYSRVTTKDVTFEEIDLNEMIEQLKDLELANNLEEANGSVLVPEPLLSINSDVSQTRQLLQNLITNALKYRKKDAPPEITIRTHKQDNNMVRVEVQDNGIGIEEKQYNNIFVMFRRLHSRQEYDGTGIGLAVCKKIVERHNGEIGVSSTYGQGSTFWFTIPAAKTAGREQEQLVSSLTS